MAFIKAVLTVLLATTICALANDADMLQDVCVADLNSAILVNGFPCKNAPPVADDFSFAGIAQPLPIVNKKLNAVVTTVNVEKIPGLNTLGVSMARIDYGPGGLNPPHIHPRATEIIFVLEGTLKVGFVTTKNVLISKVVNKGEVFVFPRGLVHFQKNPSPTSPASVIVAFNSQNPGAQQFAAALFTSKPAIPNDVLAQAFNIGIKQVKGIRAGLAA